MQVPRLGPGCPPALCCTQGAVMPWASAARDPATGAFYRVAGSS
jgi:hypothetical protein